MNYAIATVILIGITISLIFGFLAWLMGVWVTEQQEFTVRPILKVIGAKTGLQQGAGGTPVLVLYIENKGTASIKILRVEIRGSEGYYYNDLNQTVAAGSELTITIDSWLTSGSPPPIIKGHMYRVLIYTDKLSTIFYDVVAS